ncbi:MAG TPA: methyltransferase domain-containing protein [Steroidobacteraceae bacterium]|nr:methyltransferase domain-containing protein [Steroidobacteraceae bacterium]
MTEAGRGPLLTSENLGVMVAALRAGATHCACSVDLGLTVTEVALESAGFSCDGALYPWPQALRDRTIYYWNGAGFEPVSSYSGSLIKLVPTPWGAPTFEIDGIKMLPTARESPFADARRKVELVGVRGRRVLDTCGGLGYFAAWCLRLGAAQVLSCEKNPGVLWLRELNPWSPPPDARLTLRHAAIETHIGTLTDATFDVVLHDPPRIGIAGELYSKAFYRQLARVLRPGGVLFHYTGNPNRLTSGRDVPGEVLRRLRDSGFSARRALDGVLARSVFKPVR